MRLAVIDPGESTGVAVFTLRRLSPQLVTSALIDHFTVGQDEYGLGMIRDKIREADEVLAEEGPLRRHSPRACIRVEQVIRDAAHEKPVHWIRPTEWKPHPAASLEPQDEPQTIHESDVIRMGRWFINTRSQSFVF